ncbi:MAG: hypothetical protein Tsb0034_17800 [Ekhidna sp.]
MSATSTSFVDENIALSNLFISNSTERGSTDSRQGWLEQPNNKTTQIIRTTARIVSIFEIKFFGTGLLSFLRQSYGFEA